MKMYKYMSLLGLAGLANCFDAATSYTVSTNSSNKYITLTPTGSHTKTLLYLHGGAMSAQMAYDGYLKTN